VVWRIMHKVRRKFCSKCLNHLNAFLGRGGVEARRIAFFAEGTYPKGGEAVPVSYPKGAERVYLAEEIESQIRGTK